MMLSITMTVLLRMLSYDELLEYGIGQRYMHMQCELATMAHEAAYPYCYDVRMNVYEAHTYQGR